TILNNMTLKRGAGYIGAWVSFGTILNNMTLKQAGLVNFG
ncbi:hypothetical protein D351_00152, partial [Enterococcus faecalis WKS-26-18-2]